MTEERLRWIAEASKRRRYLVGVSGGADSVALVELLARAGFGRLVVCHLDHGLRGAAARADARFVKSLAKRLGVDFEGGRTDVAGAMATDGMSMETAGRRARHAFFAECGRRRRCRTLLLGHHADDQAETVLWNLLRGSRGASGMSECQELVMHGRRMTVVRPLLGVRRAELRDWLTAEGVAWREDASNDQPVAVRNRLRHEALPLLGEIAGRDVAESLTKAAESAAELREIERWAVARAAAVDPQGRLHLPQLRTLPQVLQRACVFDFLSRAGVPGIDRAVIGRAMEVVENGGALSLPDGWWLRRRQGRLVVGGPNG